MSPDGGRGPAADALVPILADRTHGASEIEECLLAALLDLVAGPVPVGGSCGELLVTLSRSTRELQPAMANLLHLANQAWLSWQGEAAEEARRQRLAGIWRDRLEGRCRRTASLGKHLAGLLGTPRASLWTVLTLSRSGTVISVLASLAEEDFRIAAVVGEGRPGGEGLGAADEMRSHGIDAWVATDAAVMALAAGAPPPPALRFDRRRTAVIVGADAVGPEVFINKVGTRPLAALRVSGMPCWVLAEEAKLLPPALFRYLELPSAPATDLEAPTGVPAVSFDFEAVPLELVDLVVTEEGVFPPGEIRQRLERVPVSSHLRRCLAMV